MRPRLAASLFGNSLLASSLDSLLAPVAQMSACIALCLLLASPLVAQSAPAPAAASIPDPVAYLASQFGTAFTLDPAIPPMFGDLDGDGNEDLVLVGTSGAALAGQSQFSFKVADPYDAYFGTGDTRITSTFSLHFDGSSRCILVVFGWRLPPQAKPKSKQVSKFVLINTPFESVKLVNLRLKKKNIQAIETVDRDTLHALVFWDGKRWFWRAQGMEGDETLMPRRN
jgi:hypothetical protein